MKRLRTKMIIGLSLFLLAGVIGSLIAGKGLAALYLPLIFNNNARSGYVVLAWNDLGMHCYNRNFQDLGVLPPFDNLWAQVVKVGDPPQIITTGIEVTYEFPNNTYSVGKSDFWTYAKQLFSLDSPLPADIGLTGKGLAGTMDLDGDHFKVDGIPLTEFQDTAPTTPYPYQLATVIVRDTQTKVELARTITVAPVSTEMHCDNCHNDGGVEGIATGRVETNILTLHDQENMAEYPAGHTGALMSRRPVLCAECHASNALGKPGVGNLPNFSKAMHRKHKDEVSADMNGCYQCHPGPNTQCLRDTMFREGLTCTSTDCHGTLAKVAQNPNPWLNEPKCTTCHPSIIQDQPLYRHSTGHKGIRCAACHDSPHAIAPTNQPNDAIKFLGWQGKNGPLSKCTVCHLTKPTRSMPHGK